MIRIIKFQHYRPLAARWLSNLAMIRFPLPDLGEKIKEGRIKKLYVREGDRVSEFSKLADVQSDKQFTQITSPQEGIIKKIYYHQDQLCQVGDIFLDIETAPLEGAQQTQKAEQLSSPPVFQPIPQPSLDNQHILASATVKMWARQHKIDLSEVSGTGRKGRILKEDIINHIQNEQKASLQKKITQQIKPLQIGEISKIKMNAAQKEIYNLVSYSCSIPHLYFQQTFDVTQLLQICESTKSKNNKITLLSLLIKTFSLALNQFPRVNSLYSLSNQFNFKQVPFQNLLLPLYANGSTNFSIINQLQKRSVIDIQKQLDNISNGQISLNSVKQNIVNATISLSDIGQIGGLSLNPLIYGEIACHASIGSLHQKIIYRNGITVKKTGVEVVIGADHRVLDGATVARFAMVWKQLSQNPRVAFLNMI